MGRNIWYIIIYYIYVELRRSMLNSKEQWETESADKHDTSKIHSLTHLVIQSTLSHLICGYLSFLIISHFSTHQLASTLRFTGLVTHQKVSLLIGLWRKPASCGVSISFPGSYCDVGYFNILWSFVMCHRLKAADSLCDICSSIKSKEFNKGFELTCEVNFCKRGYNLGLNGNNVLLFWVEKTQ